jgi:hypothetical protein
MLSEYHIADSTTDDTFLPLLCTTSFEIHDAQVTEFVSCVQLFRRGPSTVTAEGSGPLTEFEFIKPTCQRVTE